MTGTILIASAEQLFDDLDPPLNETMASLISQDCSYSESALGCKPFVLTASELCAIMTDDFLRVPGSEKQTRVEVTSLMEMAGSFCINMNFL